ncbi:MAG: hypothetical protein JXK95_16655, partial [Bacteroidales bacterium]|nr:hypothetical protein [Bacteroidales bacterium]
MNALAIMLVLVFNVLHPVHISYTNLDISSETGEVNLVCKFFSDDLALLFYHIYEREVIFDPESEIAASDLDLVTNHLLNSFFVKEPGGKTVNFLYNKKEQNDESVWLYFEGRLSGKQPDSLLLENTLLLDLYEDQKNLVIVNYGGMEKGVIFDYLRREINIVLKAQADA